MFNDISTLLKLAICSIAILSSGNCWADITNWDNNPMNYENSEMNFNKSPMNYNYSPMNYQNNPMNYNSDRIIRDNSGNAMGYEVPKPNGGVNYFDLEGHRRGYQGPGSRWKSLVNMLGLKGILLIVAISPAMAGETAASQVERIRGDDPKRQCLSCEHTC